MKKVYFRSLSRVYSFDGNPPDLELPAWLWAVEYPHDGVLQEDIEECFENSQSWTGWTFFHVPLTMKDFEPMEAVTVFLFKDVNDAFWAEFKWGSGSRLNNLPREAFER